jgi:protocatechuate 3,4-dioxygenase beta subunit
MAIVAGRVVDVHGAPVPSARVMFVESPLPVPDIAALSGTDGRFVLDAPVPGRYVIQAVTDVHPPAHAEVDVGPDDQLVEVDVPLPE